MEPAEYNPLFTTKISYPKSVAEKSPTTMNCLLFKRHFLISAEDKKLKPYTVYFTEFLLPADESKKKFSIENKYWKQIPVFNICRLVARASKTPETVMKIYPIHAKDGSP